MKKTITVLWFVLISCGLYSQDIDGDTLTHVFYVDEYGNQKRAVVASPSQILIVSGDSIYVVKSEFQLQSILRKRDGFDIINHPDSVCIFIRKRIKAVVILEGGD